MKDTFENGFCLAAFLEKNNFMIKNLFPYSLDNMVTLNMYDKEDNVRTVVYFDFDNLTISCLHNRDDYFTQIRINHIERFSIMQGYKKPLNFHKRQSEKFLFDQQQKVDLKLRSQDANYKNNNNYYLTVVDTDAGAINIDEMSYDTLKQIIHKLFLLEECFHNKA